MERLEYLGQIHFTYHPTMGTRHVVVCAEEVILVGTFGLLVNSTRRKVPFLR